MSSEPKKRHTGATVTIVVVVLIVLCLLSAFIWPGWAVEKTSQHQAPSPAQSSEAAKNDATMAAKAPAALPLPDDATNLLKAMPATVGSYSRQQVTNVTLWGQALPLEEHQIVYSNGTASQDITLTVAQWALSDNAKSEFASLAAKMTGTKIADGDVKVNGQAAGSYQVNEDQGDSSHATALWQNSTCIFQVTGPTAQVKTFYKQFPL
ncbi:MAG: hypothetical protein U0K19_04790 [Bifidobacteriaceae bacterium]|nr:hypothetical protein [Bifidobacteriaceae bacterium]